MQILRLPQVLQKRGKGRSAHYADIQQGLFTKPIPIGCRAIGWPDYEAEVLTAAQIAGKTHAEIRQLVQRLEAQRATLLDEVLAC